METVKFVFANSGASSARGSQHDDNKRNGYNARQASAEPRVALTQVTAATNVQKAVMRSPRYFVFNTQRKQTAETTDKCPVR